MLAAKQITDDLRKSFRGRLAFDPLVRGVYSADASPFHILPHGVAFPEDADDLATLVKYAFKQGLPLIPRGAGTGVAGESLGPGLVVDLSTRFRTILDITDDTATVQPGVTLAQGDRTGDGWADAGGGGRRRPADWPRTRRAPRVARWAG